MRIHFANQAMKDAFGKGPDVIGKLYRDVLPELENQEVFEQLDQVFETGKPDHSRTQPFKLIINGQLETHYYTCSYSPLLNAAGEVYGIVNTASDVTDLVLARQKVENYAEELQESEQRFRLMADASPAMIWALDPDSSLKYANKFLLEFLGISFEKFMADNWVPYIHPEDRKRSVDIITEAIGKRQQFHNEHRLLRQDGEHRWLLSQEAPSYYANGELYGYVGSSIDITEIKQTEIKLQRYAKELAAANEELYSSSNQLQETNKMLSSSNQKLSHINADIDNFIYTASHDLRTPISNIEGLMNAILEDLPVESMQEPGMQKLFELVTSAIDRFKQTINDLTEITKLQREDVCDKDSQVDLASVIMEVQLDLSSPIKQAKAKLDVGLNTCEPVRLSPKNVRSIVYNLISNAVKSRSPARQLLIQVRCYQQEHYQVLSIQDNGLGMDLSDESKVFGMFKRLHDHVEGTGIGLYMVKKILENAGGRIEVENRVGEGSTFRVYFRQGGSAFS